MQIRTHLWFYNLLLLAALVCPLPSILAQGTAFTYNGSFNDGSTLAVGNYDLNFTLFDAFTNGVPLQPECPFFGSELRYFS